MPDIALTMRLLLFTSKTCPACQDLKKRKVVELFLKDHPEVELVSIDTDSREGGERADLYAANDLPTLLFEQTTGRLAARSPGPCTLKELEALYRTAQAIK